MRKLKLQVQMTIDGFIGGPNGEMDFMEFNWDNKLKEYVGSITESIDCIVLGRKLAQGFIPYWASHPEQEGASVFNKTKKIVFTKTLDKNEWNDTVELEKGDLVEAITKLKSEPGDDIIAYGGAEFVSNLIRNGLIDEFHLFINPSAIGSGLPIFNALDNKQPLKLVSATPFDCGITVLHYQKKQVD